MHTTESYPTLIRKIIFKKVMRLERVASREGKNQAIKETETFTTHLTNAFREQEKAKLDCLVKHAEMLIEKRLEKHPRAIVGILLKLLKNIAEHADVEVTAHKLDADILRASLNEITLASASARKVTIADDNSFSRGSLVIKAHKSIVDGQIKTQTGKAREILLSFLARRTNGSIN